MPDQDLYPVSITKPCPRQRNRWVKAQVPAFAATATLPNPAHALTVAPEFITDFEE